MKGAFFWRQSPTVRVHGWGTMPMQQGREERTNLSPLLAPQSLSSNFLGLFFTDQAQLKSRGHNTPGHHPNSAYPGDTPQCEGSQYLARERSRIIADRRDRM